MLDDGEAWALCLTTSVGTRIRHATYRIERVRISRRCLMVLHEYIKYQQSAAGALWLCMIPSYVRSCYVAGGHDMAQPLHRAGRLTGLYLSSI